MHVSSLHKNVARTAGFYTKPVADPGAVRFRENWGVVRVLLTARRAATHRELLADWPPDRPSPTARQLYEWLARAVSEGLAERLGSGTRRDAYRFRLPAAKGLSSLPELRPLGE